MVLTKEDQDRIGAAIRAAEARTEGEIVCVLAKSSSDYAVYPLAWSALAALIAPWLLVTLTALSVERVLLIQLLLFLGLYVLFSVPAIHRLLVPRPVQRASAHRAAMEQFMIRGMSRKANRAGVLIFVSLEEHYARIVADQGITAKVDQSVWRGAIDALISHMREERIADGFIAALEQCAGVLAEHFPVSAAPTNDLPDRIYLI
ncbi:TPM domain-containing protein [Methyloferula stellata]|uniref:TPM domain-containing protein n=1 Tax=Methyloferula stellata TaxID=876270 RepID=UPI00035C4711|nr:TPM domain-containing protein [Methyloferula stellata]